MASVSTATAVDEVIRTEELTKVYPGGVRAVDGLDLSVRRGEIFGLLGPNGAGKTTTAGMLTTMVIPTSGRAYVGGIDVVAHPVAAKQVIGVVPQTNTLDRSLSVWENLYFHGRFFGMTRAHRQARGRHAARAVPARRPGHRARARAVGRDGATAHGGAGDHAPTRHPVPRRADRRPRPAEPARALGDPRRAAPRRPDRPPHHALHGGGRPALRPARDHRPRQAARARHAGRAQGVDRCRHHRDRLRVGRPRRARHRAARAGDRARSRPPASTAPSCSRCGAPRA